MVRAKPRVGAAIPKDHESLLGLAHYTFYRPLLDKDGKPTQNFHVLKNYRQHTKEGDLVLLKVPQVIIARKLRKGPGFVENDAYLNPEIFAKQFYQPPLEILGPCLNGSIFEQEYHPKNDRFPPAKIAQDLDQFFGKIPQDNRYHIELQTEAYWSGPVYEVLKKHGIGLVFFHWTWLPPLRKQFARVNKIFFNSGKQVVIRLMTPRRWATRNPMLRRSHLTKWSPACWTRK